MRSVHGTCAGMLLGVIAMLNASFVYGQTASSGQPELKTRAELTGIAGGSALIGDGIWGDGVWGIKFGTSSTKRYGFDGVFEQSMRLSRFRYLGADFLVQFPERKAPARVIPFLNVGAGSYFYDRHHLQVLSFGVGIKQYFNKKLGIRLGVQDRMSFRYPRLHRLDFYGGLIVRF